MDMVFFFFSDTRAWKVKASEYLFFFFFWSGDKQRIGINELQLWGKGRLFSHAFLVATYAYKMKYVFGS